MFKPKYKYTDKIIGLLTRIAAAREVILGVVKKGVGSAFDCW